MPVGKASQPVLSIRLQEEKKKGKEWGGGGQHMRRIQKSKK